MTSKVWVFLRAVLFFIQLFGSVLYWAGMSHPNYGIRVGEYGQTFLYGLFETCHGYPQQYLFPITCKRYDHPEPYLETSVALYGVWILFNSLILLMLLCSPCIRIRKGNENKVFTYNIVMSMLSVFANVFLWSSYLYFSYKLKAFHSSSLRLGSAFATATSGVAFMTAFYLFVVVFPMIARRMDEFD
ncbi:hypothetical protein GJ496_000228 [Pomphorhynchus laevis]|nr:hypothetical protein GJ496_000228 [Pomphorhynchus laevis]